MGQVEKRRIDAKCAGKSDKFSRLCLPSEREIAAMKDAEQTHVIAVDSIKIRTVLLFSVEKSKNGGPSNCLLLSLIFRFWFFK
jgi:hypothetical protein